MRSVFADAFYWIAVADPRDRWHAQAADARKSLGSVILVTTDEVLIEFLAAFAQRGTEFRSNAVKMVRAIMRDLNVRVVAQSRDSLP